MGRHGGRVMMGMAGAALGVGIIWMVLMVQQALRLADSPGGWLVALSAGVVGPVLGLRLLDRGLARRERSRPEERGAGRLERELLAVLAAHGTLTPAAAALRTSLTLDEAESLLEALASMGTVQAVDGADGRAYELASDAGRRDAGAVMPDESGEDPVERVADGLRRPPEPLSERELDVLALAATGRTNREIAGALSLSVGTVRSLTDNISRKLGASDRTEAIARARSLALV